jgi:3-phenylpropionate/trans-cinnamate dioxygenase ferredoxin subunit
MTERIACQAAVLDSGSILRVEIARDDGTTVPVAVVRSADGGLFAVDDTCSHGAVSLSEGEVDGGEIECWGHGARFDLTTGRATALPAVAPIRTYPIRIEGEDVLVDVDAPATTKEDA